MPVKFRDYYETLSVSRKASQNEIQRAYRKLARKFHPDVNKNKDAEDKFKQINEAYEVLKDPEKRRKYDSLGADWRSGQDFRPPPGWENVHFDFRSGSRGADGFDFADLGVGGFSDFFETLFGRGGPQMPGQNRRRQQSRPKPRASRGENREADLTIGLEDAYHGGKKKISLQLMEPGPNHRLRPTVMDYEVTIPAGITDGRKIRLSGQGAPGIRGGPPGDLYLKVTIRPHPSFRLKEFNLEVTVPITPWEAALGTKIKVPTLDGPVTMTVPPGAQGGQRFRLKGKGMPKTKAAKGDLFALVQIAVPKSLSDKERELFEKLAEESDFKPRK